MRYPKDLKKTGRDFWKKVLAGYELTDAHDLTRLHMACRCLEDINTAEEQITKDGDYVKDRYGQVKEHQAGKVIRDNRTLFCRIIRELNLDIEAPETRPPRRY